MNEELIRFYVGYIFEFLKECKEGQGLFFRTINHKTEKDLTRNQRNEFHFILDLLLRNNYLEVKDNDFICLTSNGFRYLNDDLELCLHIALHEQLNSMQKFPLDKSRIFSELWTIIGHKEKALYPVSGPAFYDTIKPYLPGSLPPTYSKYISELREADQSTSRADWFEALFLELEPDDITLFLSDLSDGINQSIDAALRRKSSDVDDMLSWEDLPQDTKPSAINRTHVAVGLPVGECLDHPAADSADGSPKIPASKCPRVLISYAWEEENSDFMQWILDFARKLRERGIDAQIDQYQVHGTDLVMFMRDELRKDDKIVCVLTPKYKEKAESGAGGAAYEGSIISHGIYNDQGTTKFIPVLKKGDWKASTPDFMDGRKGFDFLTNEDKELEKLVTVLKGGKVIPEPPIRF